MKWGMLGYLLALAFGVLLALATRDGQATLQRIHDAQVETRQWQAKYAEASLTVQRAVDTVQLIVPAYKARRDTLLINVRDTVEVLRYVAVADSAVHACTELVTSCERFRVTADSMVNALSREKDLYRDLYNAERRNGWRKRLGVTVGYGLTKAGDEVKIGPQLGLTFRVWP